MTTYTTCAWCDMYAVRADWGQAACPVEVRVEAHGEWRPDEQGRQVADFSHSPEAAMRALLRDVARGSGDDPDDEEIAAQIEAALTFLGASAEEG